MNIQRIVLLLLLYFCLPELVQSQECLGGGCTGGSQYPTGTFTSNTNSWTTVTSSAYAGEYAVYSVTSGSTYEWSLCSADGGSASYDAQLTLINGSGVGVICYSDDICDSNKPKIQWTATSTTTVRVLIAQYNCVSNSSFTTIVWRCSSCGSGSAPANDNCPNATNLTVSSTCTTTNGTVAGATQSIAAISCGGVTGTANDDVWYKFTATSSSYHTVTVTGSASFDAVVDVRSGACNGTNIACADATGSGGTEVVNLSGLTNGTTYYVRVYDYYSGVPATQTFTICVTNSNNCTPYYSSGTSGGDFINRVQLASIDNTPAGTGSTSGPSYNDYYASVSTNLQAGTNQNLTVTVGTYGGQTVAAWIDYNNNNLFEAGEKLGEVANLAASTSGTINFTIPSGTATGNKRMRVRTVWSTTSLDPCATYSYGEAEDYKVNITAACNTPTTPGSPNTTGITTSGAQLNWSASTGSATITYYWALGTSASVTYDANYIQRGTTTSLNTGALTGLSPGTTYYWVVKARTSCDNTESSYTSVINFTTSCTTPSSPTSINTTNVSTTSATLNWTASASGSPTITYYWAVGSASNVTYEANYLQRGTTTGTSENVFNLTANTTYYWTVKAVTSCNNSASSYPSAISFTTSSVPTPLITWNGNTSTDWNTTTNWTPNQVPTATDNVVIPTGRPNYPVITSVGLSINNTTVTNRCKSLHIDAGGRITVDGTGLYIHCSGDLNISGVFNHHATSNSNRFEVNSGAVVKVKNGGYLNVGSTALSGVTSGTPSGTINVFNDIYINAGQLIVEPGGTVYVQDALTLVSNAASLFKQEGGLVSIAMSGQGSTTQDKISVASNATFRLINGTLRVSGDADGATTTWDAMWFSFSSVIDIQGGTIELLSGTTVQDFTLTLGNPSASAALNHLVINKSGQTVLLDGISNPLQINGNLTILAGTFNANGFNTTLAGNFSNSGIYTAGSGTLTLTGSGKLIDGSSGTTFNNVTMNSGASYTINPSYVTVPQATFNGNLTINSGATLTLATTKIISLAGATNTISGTLTAVDNLDGTRDIGFNNAGGTLSCTGTLNADIQISSGTTTLNTNTTINGDFFANTGTFTMGTEILTINGGFTNNGTFNAGTGTVILAGTSKNINGSSTTTFNHLTIQSGSSYTLNPSTPSDVNVNGNFLHYGNTTIASGKYFDLYAATSESESIVLDGTITATDVFNATKDIDINNTVNLSGSGTINADLRIFSGITTLTSNFTLNGDFEIRNAAGPPTFTMTTHTFTVGGNWTTVGVGGVNTFNRGTGTIVFNGTNDRTLRTGSTQTGGTIDYNHFYNVTINMASGKTITMIREGTDDNTNGLRVLNDLIITSGTLSTGGNSYVGRKMRSDKLTRIYSGATLNIGGNSSTEAGYGNWVTEFRGDLFIDGSITTTRPKNSGFAEIFLYGARIAGQGLLNEVGCDVQLTTSSPITVYQLDDLSLEGDLIIQDNSTYICNSPFNLTVGGHFYVYHSLTHRGNVTVKGHFLDQSGGTNPVNSMDLASSTFNFSQSGSKYISFNGLNPVTFHNVNIISESGGTREIRNDIVVNGNLTIQSGETLDAYSVSPKNINLSGSTSSWTNNGTFTPRTGTVTFDGSGSQTMGGSTNTSFYNLTVNKSGGSELIFSNNNSVTNILTLTNGYISTTPTKLLTLTNGSSITYPGSPANSFVRGPMKKIGATNATEFIFPVGKSTRSARISVTPTSTSATNEFTAEYFYNTYANAWTVNSPLNNVSNIEYWQLDRGGATPANAAVKLYWEDAASSAINSCAAGGDLVVARWNGSAWEDRTNSGGVTGTCTGSTSGTVTSNTVTSFSPFTFGSKSNSVNSLPVELLSFDARLNSNVVDLFWATATEQNSDYFIVERSKDAEIFTPIDKVKAAGNSNTLINYISVDENPLEGTSYYRLQQVDFDGTFSYSKVVSVTIKTGVTESGSWITKSMLYPNPADNQVTLFVNSKTSCNAEILIYSISGGLISTERIQLSENENYFNPDISTLPNGVYFIELRTERDKIISKLVKQ